ncbi:TfoX/Sxy family protein [Billgrantia montanilacus]|uniref:Transcriptional regulator n=1 Tax=Billgrantia montanilacus TaxID=2282305 RepID=A0A368TXU5_9GAMM|nr:TfoX/Sxy family protein [Halomonas montanilacus]RCV89518.1 transcriptional regulator [Halomonas montanilacus]
MSEYTDYLQDVFAQFGPVSARGMFGGYGLYHQGLMFALVADDTLYLKADAGNVGDFEREGLEPFLYLKGGREVRMSYYRAPEAIFEDHELAAEWAGGAFQAALRAKAGKR